jgi:phage tail-like protein
MAEGKSANESVHHPFVAFNFAVEIRVDGVAMQVCDAAFSECDGLEMTMDVKTIREGGNNGKQIRLTGPYNYGNVTLKRGMTSTFDLWKWMDLMLTQPSLRADADVIVFASDHTTERARFRLTRCVPVKLKAPPLNAKDGIVAIEELQLSYESLTLKDQDDTSGA